MRDLSWAGLIEQGFKVEAKHPYFGWKPVSARLVQRIGRVWPIRLANGPRYLLGSWGSRNDMSWSGLMKKGHVVELKTDGGWRKIRGEYTVVEHVYPYAIRLAKFQTGLDNQ